MASGGTRQNQQEVLYLFERIGEPIFVPKGNGKVVYNVPTDMLADRFQAMADELVTRFGQDVHPELSINVKNITLPDLSGPLQLGRRESFSLFLPSHRRLASRLIEVFMGMRSYEDFLAATVYCRDRMNPGLYVYALSVALLHRPDTRQLEIPPLSEVFPDKFMEGSVFVDARIEANVMQQGERVPLEIPQNYTASDLEDEHRLAYFREDVGICLHHWHWHLVYPFEGPRDIVNKDRRGELFYYMHQQIVARYNFERLCNNLQRVTRFHNFDEAIPEAYFPKLESLVASRVYPPRPRNMSMSDVNREADDITFDIQDLVRWRERIYEAIHQGFVLDEQGRTVPLTEDRGIDILGNIVESSILSPNRNLYGELHNMGHLAIAYIHDPDHRFLETFGVMGDSTTAMRDPIFYRWHAFLDHIFQEHKRRLTPYTAQSLAFPGIRVSSVTIETQGVGQNILSTFWQQSDVDLSRGLDFAPQGALYARLTHLQHRAFNYRIQIENSSNIQQMGTIRIFLAPKFDERGQPFLFREQRQLMLELDKFTALLQPRLNTVERRSDSSSVTIPFERTFRDLEQRPAAPSPGESFDFCGCGWPQHMLIPKGKVDGYPCELFVMVTNWSNDRVDNVRGGACSDASSYCGIRNSNYPDRRPMGYPFDRMPRYDVDTLGQFLTPNMSIIDVSIQHANIVEPPRA